MENYKKYKIVSFNINIISIPELINKLKNFLQSKKGHYICISNVHACIEAYDDYKFTEIVNNADLALPDGRPIYWALKLFDFKEATHLPGYEVTKNLCNFAAKEKLNVGFYGGEIDTLNRCVLNLQNKYQGLKINYVYSPPFRDLTKEEKEKIIENINNNKIQILFVSLGCPKQEYWMAEHKIHLKCISVGIGEAVSLLSNKTKLAPKWVERISMRWLTRLISEPKRLFWRYFYTNSKFIYLISKQYLKYKFK